MYTNITASQIVSQYRKIVILPIGSYEQHGPHLPVDTDLRIAQLLASALYDSLVELNPLLLPAIPFSCSWEHKGPGTLAFNTATVSAILHDLAQSLKSWDIPVLLVLVNWHGGNDVLASLATEISATEDIPTAVIPAISQVGKAWDESMITTAKEIHAGAIETSIIMAYWPELMYGEVGKNDHCEPDIAPTKAQAIMQSLGIRTVTNEGIWGAPEDANPEKGKDLIQNLTQKTHDQVQKLYELVNMYGRDK